MTSSVRRLVLSTIRLSGNRSSIRKIFEKLGKPGLEMEPLVLGARGLGRALEPLDTVTGTDTH
jgi:hypothetical protein